MKSKRCSQSYLNRVLLSISLCFTALALNACGYQLGTPASSHKKAINATGGVAVTIASNQTLYRNIEPNLRQQVESQLEEQGIKTASAAPYQLLLSIQSLDTRALRATNANVLAASEYQTSIRTNWSLVKDKQQVVAGTATGQSTFFAGLASQSQTAQTIENSNFIQASKQSQPQALQDLAKQIATELAIGF